ARTESRGGRRIPLSGTVLLRSIVDTVMLAMRDSMFVPMTCYPWTPDGPGLCRVLRDPGLLASAFQDRKWFRELVVRLAPPISRTAPRSLVLAGSQPRAALNSVVGPAIVKVLSDSTRRARCFKALAKVHKGTQGGRRFLAQGLYHRVKDQFERDLPKLEYV